MRLGSETREISVCSWYSNASNNMNHHSALDVSCRLSVVVVVNNDGFTVILRNIQRSVSSSCARRRLRWMHHISGSITVPDKKMTSYQTRNKIGTWLMVGCSIANQKVSRCRTRGVTRMPQISKIRLPTLALIPRGDITRSPEQGYQGPHKKSSKFSNKKFKKWPHRRNGYRTNVSRRPTPQWWPRRWRRWLWGRSSTSRDPRLPLHNCHRNNRESEPKRLVPLQEIKCSNRESEPGRSVPL